MIVAKLVDGRVGRGPYGSKVHSFQMEGYSIANKLCIFDSVDVYCGTAWSAYAVDLG